MNSCQTVEYDGAIWAQTFLRNSAEMLADPKWFKEVFKKEVENRGKYIFFINNLIFLKDIYLF